MKILVAVEQSKFSEKALERAVDMARKENAELTALTVAELVVGMEEVSPATFLEDRLMEIATATAERAKAFAEGKGVPLKTIVEGSASPAGCILDTAMKTGADLIVMGSRGKKGLERFLLGSVATKVVAHAPCSVLIVR